MAWSRTYDAATDATTYTPDTDLNGVTKIVVFHSEPQASRVGFFAGGLSSLTQTGNEVEDELDSQLGLTTRVGRA